MAYYEELWFTGNDTFRVGNKKVRLTNVFLGSAVTELVEQKIYLVRSILFMEIDGPLFLDLYFPLLFSSGTSYKRV